MIARVILLMLAVLLGGCSGLGVYSSEPVSGHLDAVDSGEAVRCARLFAKLDSLVNAMDVRDARATRLPGLPYLRSDRLLGALAEQADGGDGLGAWVRLAGTMDEESRRHEMLNLPDSALAMEMGVTREALADSLRQCRLELAAVDLADSESRERLRTLAQVPGEYQTWKRALGLYPLTRVAFAHGIHAWQAATRTQFGTPLAELPRQGTPVMYAPPGRTPAAESIAGLFSDTRRNSLGVFDWNDAELDALFALYAPHILIDEAGVDDRIGLLEYGPETRLEVDTLRPVVYRRLSHTLLDGRWLPQFVYSIWFPARTAKAGIDLLAGRFDGLIWRVTVGPDGNPLVYDTIHSCGCYHLFLPTAAVRARPQPESLDETLFAPQLLARVSAGVSTVLHLEAGTHYLQRVTLNDEIPPTRVYKFANDDDLRSLPLPDPPPGGAPRRSAFGSDGIVAGSERGERFLFWPMGVDNPGAMRQWGRHATAFVGERHFDDPKLFDKYFELR